MVGGGGGEGVKKIKDRDGIKLGVMVYNVYNGYEGVRSVYGNNVIGSEYLRIEVFYY